MVLHTILRTLAAVLFIVPTFTADAQTKTIKIGVTPGPHARIAREVATLGAKQGLTIHVIEIRDYAVLNQALAAGDLDANSFQNAPYLDQQIVAHGYKLVAIGKTILVPMGIYAKKITHLAGLRDGAQIGVPNDPTNEWRALELLQSARLIRLRSGRERGSLADVVENPKQVHIRELNAARTIGALDDLDAACVNGNYAASAGLIPSRDAIFVEPGGGGEALRSRYSNIIVVRAADRDAPWAKELVALYQSGEVRRFILRHFGGSIYPAF